MMRVVVCGGGFVGVYAALRLERRLGRGDEIVLVNDENYLQYQPVLPEPASGPIEPPHGSEPSAPLLAAVPRTPRGGGAGGWWRGRGAGPARAPSPASPTTRCGAWRDGDSRSISRRASSRPRAG